MTGLWFILTLFFSELLYWVGYVLFRYRGDNVGVLQWFDDSILHHHYSVGGGPVRGHLLSHGSDQEALAALLLSLPLRLLRIPLPLQRTIQRTRSSSIVAPHPGKLLIRTAQSHLISYIVSSTSTFRELIFQTYLRCGLSWNFWCCIAWIAWSEHQLFFEILLFNGDGIASIYLHIYWCILIYQVNRIKPFVSNNLTIMKTQVQKFSNAIYLAILKCIIYT